MPLGVWVAQKIPLNSEEGAVPPPNFPQDHGVPAAVLPDRFLNSWHLKFCLLDTGQIPSLPLTHPLARPFSRGPASGAEPPGASSNTLALHTLGEAELMVNHHPVLLTLCFNSSQRNQFCACI